MNLYNTLPHNNIVEFPKVQLSSDTDVKCACEDCGAEPQLISRYHCDDTMRFEYFIVCGCKCGASSLTPAGAKKNWEKGLYALHTVKMA